jgi:hypothetical protein
MRLLLLSPIEERRSKSYSHITGLEVIRDRGREVHSNKGLANLSDKFEWSTAILQSI